MRISFESKICEVIVDDFKQALLLRNEETDTVIEQLMMQYIAKSMVREKKNIGVKNISTYNMYNCI